jgi:hypothetical protein
MPRHERFFPGGYVYHPMNRAAARTSLFHKDNDYRAFRRVLDDAIQEHPIRLLAYLTPNIQYPIQIVKWLGEGVYGQAKGGTIYLTKQAFDTGTKKLAAILFEEFVHNHYNLLDETREMQSWLFERIVTMGEEFALGEPLFSSPITLIGDDFA